MNRMTVRILVVSLLVAISMQCLFAAETATTTTTAGSTTATGTKLPDYEPYTKDEFPIWSGKLRRAESLFFGSFPLAFPLVALAYNLAVNLGAPPVEETAGIKTVLVQLGAAAGVSFTIALTDFIIGEVKGE
ncbi:MAG: hypothetical protein SPD11_01745 [Sphaerochaetaceae bacterium]|nr:hypothetical protein [Sphaerochaetaceae bacterium]